MRVELEKTVVLAFPGTSVEAFTDDHATAFRKAMFIVMRHRLSSYEDITIVSVSERSLRRAARWLLAKGGQMHSKRRRQDNLRGTTIQDQGVTLDIDFKMEIVSDSTDVAEVESSVTSELLAAFAPSSGDDDGAAATTPFDEALARQSTAAGIEVGVVVQEDSEEELTKASTVGVMQIVTAAPTIQPTISLMPSSLPTPQPSIAHFGLLDADAVETVATATAAAVGASVGASVGTSVGASTGASTGGSAGSGSSAPGGDPLTLIFLVQAIAITRNIATMPATYRDDFAGAFSMFNLQSELKVLVPSALPFLSCFFSD